MGTTVWPGRVPLRLASCEKRDVDRGDLFMLRSSSGAQHAAPGQGPVQAGLAEGTCMLLELWHLTMRYLKNLLFYDNEAVQVTYRIKTTRF